MAQFRAYRNRNSAASGRFPYLLDIQSNLLDELRTTVVVPLSPMHRAEVISRVCPLVDIGGEAYVSVTQEIAGVERSVLGEEVADLYQYRSDIIAALDFIIGGV